ncbi:MAG: MFS transporter [Planctomycetota bacterium]|nr:MFS transporter [Planctomycetota bacterium]
MTSELEKGALSALVMSTIAFTVCFAAWVMNGVLVTYLVSTQVFNFSPTEMGLLVGMPILSGAILRLPMGLLTDRFGGRIIFTLSLFLAAAPMFCVGYVESFQGFLILSLGFGVCGATFAVGVAFISVWYPRERMGTALGIFGAGNAGAALTSVAGPRILNALTDNGADIEQWRVFPKLMAGLLIVTAIAFFLLTKSKKPEATLTFKQRLSPLGNIRVWRFGLYYFLVFGCFVALAQWMIPYYVNVYGFSLASAGMLAAVFSFPSGVIRAFGGWLSDKVGARRVMYWVLGAIFIGCALLTIPKMEIRAPGPGVMARKAGTVQGVEPEHVQLGDDRYQLKAKPDDLTRDESAIFPVFRVWQEPVVSQGDKVKPKQLLARGMTRIDFAANPWVMTFFAFIVGIAMGIGKAAVYKHIPDYFPDSVGVTGGMVGVMGGLGGFACPILFGYLLNNTGVWTTCWIFIGALALVCLIWMHRVIQKMLCEASPALAQQMDTVGAQARESDAP